MSRFTYPHTIENGLGERLTFVRRIDDAQGGRLEVEILVPPGRGPVMHVHHYQTEALTVKRGRMGYQRLGGAAVFAGPGDTETFPAGDAHKFWNAGDDDLECTGYIAPADNIEYFLSGIYAAQRATGSERPALFDAAYLSRRYRSEFKMFEVPDAVQRYLFPVFIAIGTLLGRYRKFADAPAPVYR